MKRKDICAECGHIHQASSLRRSMEDHKLLCHNCYCSENRKRNELKLRLLRDYDKELGNVKEKTKRLSRLSNLFKFRGNKK